MLPRRKFREIVFQILYCQDFTKDLDDELLMFLMRQEKISKTVMRQAKESVMLLLTHLDSIDVLIESASDTYSINRISRVEKNILRLGLFELLHVQEIPAKVAISEAIRLCKKYGSPESTKFVNAILDKVYQGQSEKIISSSLTQ